MTATVKADFASCCISDLLVLYPVSPCHVEHLNSMESIVDPLLEDWAASTASFHCQLSSPYDML